jgi:REP element-mobilizing transposase RayT
MSTGIYNKLSGYHNRRSIRLNGYDYSPLREIDKHICGTSKTIGSIVRGFKIGVTKWFRISNPGTIVWQRNYFEHIIRNDKSLFLIRQYIRDNPLKWDLDSENHVDTEIREMGFRPAGGSIIFPEHTP